MASRIHEGSDSLNWGFIGNHSSEKSGKESQNHNQSVFKSYPRGEGDWYSAELSPAVSIGIREEKRAMECAQVQKNITSPKEFSDEICQHPPPPTSLDYNSESIYLEDFEQILPNKAAEVTQQSIISYPSQEISLKQPLKDFRPKSIAAVRSITSQLAVAHQQAQIQSVEPFEVKELRDSVILLAQNFAKDKKDFTEQLDNEKQLRILVERKFTKRINDQEKELQSLNKRISNQQDEICEQQQTITSLNQCITEQHAQIETLSEEFTNQCALTRVLTQRVHDRDQQLRTIQVTVDQLENTLEERTEETLEERRERARLSLENEAIRERIDQQAAVNQRLTQTTQELNRELAIVRQQQMLEKEQRELETQNYKTQLEERRALLEERVNELSLQKGIFEAQLAQKIDYQAQLEEFIVAEYAAKAARECAKVGALAATIFSVGLLPALGITTAVEKVDLPLRNALSASSNNQWQINNFRIQKNTIENSIDRLNGRINALTAKIEQLDNQENSTEGSFQV
jgi:hypothetical protein